MRSNVVAAIARSSSSGIIQDSGILIHFPHSFVLGNFNPCFPLFYTLQFLFQCRNYSIDVNANRYDSLDDDDDDDPELFLKFVRRQCKLGFSRIMPSPSFILWPPSSLFHCHPNWCCCHLGHVHLGFSLVGKHLELGIPLDVVIFTTLINGLIHDHQLG
ncbi:LOW QUALITY PROTEIN: hypothetical protein Cgig2_018056 [Carnegiea gigantea]|uniref:Uncharacterized protein n=1 Tax=Carnegiea gigantea TaxID=171969 RepID=A0A9Q1JN77_9CARY|nr:LOW QUALITY PROTEIN: hypothetical protein Cgig2_018056 [Carnegiea gigantea]